MPKINVYLPDELAEAVREAGLPVSAICQRALEQSVKRVTAIRAVALDDLATDPLARLTQVTDRVRAALRLGIEQARAQGVQAVGTEHLLHGLLAEGGNLAIRVLAAMEIQPDQLARELARLTPAAPAAPAAGPAGPVAGRFSEPAVNALELAVADAITLGHNYVGCEHVLLGILAEPDGAGGRVLRAAGVEHRSARGAVAAALAGYVHLRAQAAQNQAGQGQPGQGQAAVVDPAGALATAVRRELQPVLDRLARLERHAGLAPAAGEPAAGEPAAGEPAAGQPPAGQ